MGGSLSFRPSYLDSHKLAALPSARRPFGPGMRSVYPQVRTVVRLRPEESEGRRMLS